jgi:hypothetical protein
VQAIPHPLGGFETPDLERSKNDMSLSYMIAFIILILENTI